MVPPPPPPNEFFSPLCVLFLFSSCLSLSSLELKLLLELKLSRAYFNVLLMKVLILLAPVRAKRMNIQKFLSNNNQP